MVAVGYERRTQPLRSAQPRAFAPSESFLAFSFSLARFSHLGRIEVDVLGTAMFIPRDSRLVIETLFYIQGCQFILRHEKDVLAVFFPLGMMVEEEGRRRMQEEDCE